MQPVISSPVSKQIAKPSKPQRKAVSISQIIGTPPSMFVRHSLDIGLSESTTLL